MGRASRKLQRRKRSPSRRPHELVQTIDELLNEEVLLQALPDLETTYGVITVTRALLQAARRCHEATPLARETLGSALAGADLTPLRNDVLRLLRDEAVPLPARRVVCLGCMLSDHSLLSGLQGGTLPRLMTESLMWLVSETLDSLVARDEVHELLRDAYARDGTDGPLARQIEETRLAAGIPALVVYDQVFDRGPEHLVEGALERVVLEGGVAAECALKSLAERSDGLEHLFASAAERVRGAPPNYDFAGSIGTPKAWLGCVDGGDQSALAIVPSPLGRRIVWVSTSYDGAVQQALVSADGSTEALEELVDAFEAPESEGVEISVGEVAAWLAAACRLEPGNSFYRATALGGLALLEAVTPVGDVPRTRSRPAQNVTLDDARALCQLEELVEGFYFPCELLLDTASDEARPLSQRLEPKAQQFVVSMARRQALLFELSGREEPAAQLLALADQADRDLDGSYLASVVLENTLDTETTQPDLVELRIKSREEA